MSDNSTNIFSFYVIVAHQERGEAITKFYTARTDRVFKTIMCDENDKEFLIEFLERIINKKIYSLEFLKSELDVQTVFERTKTVD